MEDYPNNQFNASIIYTCTLEHLRMHQNFKEMNVFCL